jgi:hypothetical protein
VSNWNWPLGKRGGRVGGWFAEQARGGPSDMDMAWGGGAEFVRLVRFILSYFYPRFIWGDRMMDGC